MTASVDWVVDGLNCCCHWPLGETLQQYLGALAQMLPLRKLGGKVVVVVDVGHTDDEQIAVFEARCASRIKKGEQNVPYNFSTLCAEAWARKGARVIVTKEHEADDVIAALAAKYGATILSRDADFHRYPHPASPGHVFHYHCGQLRPTIPGQARPARSLIPVVAFAEFDPTVQLGEDGTFIRGSLCPYPDFASIHVALSALRRRCYPSATRVHERFAILGPGGGLAWHDEWYEGVSVAAPASDAEFEAAMQSMPPAPRGATRAMRQRYADCFFLALCEIFACGTGRAFTDEIAARAQGRARLENL